MCASLLLSDIQFHKRPEITEQRPGVPTPLFGGGARSFASQRKSPRSQVALLLVPSSFRPLVPKLHLGTRLFPKLRFAKVIDVRSRYRINESSTAHFVTSTTAAWLPVFTTAARCDILIQSL